MKKLIRNKTDLLELNAQLYSVAQQLDEGKTFDVTIEEHKEKRSLNANNYSWALQTKIAEALNESVDKIHEQMVLDYGVLEFVSVRKDAWESVKRAFDYCIVKGESTLNGNVYIHARVGVGTHNYNTKEMARFIDGVVNEAKELGIETLEEKRINELVERWTK